MLAALWVRVGRLDDQWSFHIQRWFRSEVFYSILPIRAEVVKSKAVERRVHFLAKPDFAFGPLRRIDQQFKHRILDALSIVQAGFRDSAQALAPLCGRGSDIVGYEYVHGWLSCLNMS